MVKLLDCTLRDGGYVNNWEFTREQYDTIVKGLQDAQVDFIEIGLIGKNDGTEFKTKFSNFAKIPLIVREGHINTKFSVMFTYGEAKGIQVPARKSGDVDIIRLAYFKPEMEDSLIMARELQEKGYIVFLQAMATFMYNDKELVEMIQKVNDVCPDYFCMVDSFGIMYGDDVQHMFRLIHGNLSKNIGIGFHAHNNQQMALSNVITFLKEAGKTSRDICVDASIYGMGRGAGNVNLELLMRYLNVNRGTHYDAEKILDLWDKNLRLVYAENYWGYAWEYFLSASYDTNAVYIWYMRKNGVKTMEQVKAVLQMLPSDCRYTLKRDIVDPIIRKVLKGNSHD